ncbi:MAG: hypothetical protein R3A52_06985 [Polyangiales bacterium]
MGRSAQAARLGTLFRDDASLLDALEWLRDLRLRIADGDKVAGSSSAAPSTCSTMGCSRTRW